MIGEAGIDTSILKAHSTRGASASKANKFGLSLPQILAQASWKSACTFNRFYNKPIEGEKTNFAKSVLTLTKQS